MDDVVFITGAAGYVGAMLADQFSKRPKVLKVICLDKDPQPQLLKGNNKIVWVQKNMSDSSWMGEIKAQRPRVVVHCAWQIREMYGKKKLQWKWNVEGSENVFRFAFENSSVKRLIHFSTASVYGAYKQNTFSHFFKEDESLREDGYLYGIEKKVAEESLKKIYDAKKGDRPDLKVFTVRPAAITGPRGRSLIHRFGLQAALSGQLKGSPLYSLIRALVSFVPATKGWVRQFIHEDDVADIIALLSFEVTDLQYEIFNITPPGASVFPKDMAEAVHKSVLPVTPFMVRLAFFWFWHLTRGKIPTAPYGWRFYSYPIVMDGSKITRLLKYEYSHKEPKEAFIKMSGRYSQHK